MNTYYVYNEIGCCQGSYTLEVAMTMIQDKDWTISEVKSL